MEKRIITISREFGSGGRTIGKALAERLGLAYYDKELVEQVSLETGFDPAYVEEHGEFAPLKNALAYAFPTYHPGVMRGLSAADFLWVMQRDVILQLAEKEPCLIVGRCADYILQDREDALHVFIHADMEFRKDRILRLYGESEKAPEKRLQEKDAKRRVNYKHFTHRDWGMSQNYHLSLNSGALGLDKCVDIIADIFSSYK